MPHEDRLACVGVQNEVRVVPKSLAEAEVDLLEVSHRELVQHSPTGEALRQERLVGALEDPKGRRQDGVLGEDGLAPVL